MAGKVILLKTGILCWDGSLAAFVLPCGRPTLRFAAGWADATPAGVVLLLYNKGFKSLYIYL